MPPQVVWTPMLVEALGSDMAKVNQLVSDFQEWKGFGPSGEDDHKVFGKDGANRDERYVRHVHLIPASDPAKRKQWETAFERFRKRTSDIYLVYADGTPAHGYLLIDQLLDPGAHDIWSPVYKSTRLAWQAMADAFIHFGTVPATKPVPYTTTNDI
jgi:Toxin YafO, type II toxin-antitoxin system